MAMNLDVAGLGRGFLVLKLWGAEPSTEKYFDWLANTSTFLQELESTSSYGISATWLQFFGFFELNVP